MLSLEIVAKRAGAGESYRAMPLACLNKLRFLNRPVSIPLICALLVFVLLKSRTRFAIAGNRSSSW